MSTKHGGRPGEKLAGDVEPPALLLVGEEEGAALGGERIHPGTVLANAVRRGGAALMRRCFYDSGLKGIGTLLFYFSIINYALGCQVPPGFSGKTRQKLVLLAAF